MLDFVIFAVTFFVALISLVFYLYPGSRRQTTIDGLDPSDGKEGNLPDITRADSFHQFFIALHKKFGSVASFWLFGPTLAVSVWSEEVVTKLDYLTEKPKELNQLFEPFVGKNSVLFSRRHELRKQRLLWIQMFDKKSIDSQKTVLKELIAELIQKWSTLSGRNVSIGQYMKAFTLRLSLITGFGDYFRQSTEELIDFGRSFENCFTELETRIAGNISSDESIRSQKFEQSVDKCRQLLGNAIKTMRTNGSDDCLIRHLLNDSSISEEQVIDESMTFVLMYYSLSSALMWTLFYLSSETELQKEMDEKLKFKIESDFIDRFIDSAITSANVIPWTSRVNPEVSSEINGHLVPKETPIVLNLSSDHFLESESEHTALDMFRKHFESLEDKPSLAFGSITSKRCCPAIDYSKFIIKSLITEVIIHFKLQSIDCDLDHKQSYKIFSKSDEEIWIKVHKK